MRARPSRGQLALRIGVIAYLGLLIAAPVFMVFRQAFGEGLSTVWDTLTSPAGVHALQYTLLMAAIAVPLNAITGVGWGLMLARGPHRLRGPLGAVLNLPFAVPPVVVGLALLLIYGRTGWFGPWLEDNGIKIIFSWPGMALATVFISLPFVAREVVPVLREVGTDQEEAARTLGATAWQAFRRVTLPTIFPAVAYGVVLTTARAIGEFGAVSVVSGRIVGQTETLPLFVENRYDQFDRAGAYSAAVLLAVLALLVLALMVRLQRRDEVKAWPSTP
jgi:sulfate/thiosulfate transport system permease protein